MTKTITISWDLPTTRESGNPLELSDIIGVEVSINAGAGFAPASMVIPTDPQVWVYPDMVDGDYTVRLVVVGIDGNSTPVDTSVRVDTSNPSQPTNVQVSLT